MTNCKAESSDAGLMHVQYGQSESENWLGPINLTATEVQVFYDHPGQLLIDSNKEFPSVPAVGQQGIFSLRWHCFFWGCILARPIHAIKGNRPVVLLGD